jgi:PKD repeat protein
VTNVTNGAVARSVTVNWGDGSSQSLGAISGNSIAQHTYSSPGGYTITATMLDSTGNTTVVSAGVVVNITTPPSLLITVVSSPPSAGLPGAYTFAVTNAANGAVARSVTVDWGDGSALQALGAISGSQTVSHVYALQGTYTITATMTDTAGNTTSVSSSVTVIPVASPTVIITPSIPGSCTGAGVCNVTFQIQVTPPTGVGIVSASINFDSPSGPVTGLGGLSGSVTVSNPYPNTIHGAVQVVVTVTDTLIVNGTNRQTQGFTTITLP